MWMEVKGMELLCAGADRVEIRPFLLRVASTFRRRSRGNDYDIISITLVMCS